MKKLTLTPAALLAKLAFAFVLTLALATLAPAPAARAAEKGATPAVISRGAEISLADNLVAGKITVFDFFSKYCPPCMTLSAPLDQLHARRDGIAVVKIDINRPDPAIKKPDLESPVARQFNLRTLPHFKIYGANGKLLFEGETAKNVLIKWLGAIGENPFNGW